MYIIPKIWADALGIEGEPYNMVDYNCLVVDDATGINIVNTLNHIIRTNACLLGIGPDAVSGLALISGPGRMAAPMHSNIGGIEFILGYFSSDIYIENLATDEVRNSAKYVAIASCARPRFDETLFIQELARHAVGQRDEEDDDDVEVKAPEPQRTRFDDIVSSFREFGQSMAEVVLPCGKSLIRPSVSSFSCLELDFDGLAKASGKNVLVVINQSQKGVVPRAVKEGNDFVIVHFNPHVMVGHITPAILPSSTFADGDRVICLGRYCNSTLVPQKRTEVQANPLYGFDRIWADEATGVTYALRKGNNIYVTVTYSDYNRYDTLVKRLGQKWTRAASTAAEDKELLTSAVGEDRSAFIKFSAENANSYIETIKEKHADVVEQVGKLQRELAEALKMQRQLAEILTAFDLDKYKRDMEEAAKKQFDAVAAMSKIKSMYVTDAGKVVVITNDIHCMDPRTKKVHDIGRLYIELNLLLPRYSESDSICIKNLKYSVQAFTSTMVAPHIFEQGNICHGNLSQSMIQHYADRDVLGMMEDLFAFVESVNVEDAAGKCIVNWPEVKEAEAVIDETDDELLANLKGGVN